MKPSAQLNKIIANLSRTETSLKTLRQSLEKTPEDESELNAKVIVLEKKLKKAAMLLVEVNQTFWNKIPDVLSNKIQNFLGGILDGTYQGKHFHSIRGTGDHGVHDEHVDGPRDSVKQDSSIDHKAG